MTLPSFRPPRSLIEVNEKGVMVPVNAFTCEVEKSANKDEFGNNVTKVKCHGKLVAETAAEMKGVVHPLIPFGGRIIVDLGDVSQLDSSGLGTLVHLKTSAIHQGFCILEFANLTPRILELLRITKLTKMFSQEKADLRSPMLGVMSDMEKGFCAGAEQQGIE